MDKYDQLHDEMLAYSRFRKAPDFKTIRSLLNLIGYEDTIPFIHVVGTNGKGSVAQLLSQILGASGLKVGLFTSPHLVDIRERMVVDGHQMSKDDFVNHITYLQNLLEETNQSSITPTFFEMMFLLALLHFSSQGVEVMILEAGIGGLHDTTNVLENRWLNVITSIGLDHTEVLGDTLEAIATEKAGIIREGVTTVALNHHPETIRVIREKCLEKKANLVEVTPFNGEIHKRTVQSIDFSLDTKYYYYESLGLNAVADYQLTNCKLAVHAYHELGDKTVISPEYVKKGVASFRWLGRMSFLRDNLLVDGAHNPDGIKAFVDHLNTYNEHPKIEVMFTCMNNKNYSDMIQSLLQIKGLQQLYIPDLGYGRQLATSVIIQTCKEQGFSQVEPVNDLKDFFTTYHHNVGAGTLLCCVGSLYLVGEVIKYIEED